MKNYQMELCGVQRTLPFIPISDDMAFASFVVLGDTELVSACAPVLAEKIGPVDAVVTAEAKGIALAYEISRLLGLKEFIVARKSQKAICGMWCRPRSTPSRRRANSTSTSTAWTPTRSAASMSACSMM